MLLLLALLQAAAGAASPPVPQNDPAEWFGSYPPAALRSGEEGRVGFEISVDAKGAVTGCRVTESSGSAVLDSATCDAMRAMARFAPARDAAGRPVAGVFKRATRWRLPEVVPVAIASFASVARLVVSPTGTVVSCTPDAKGTVPVASLGEPCENYGRTAPERLLAMKGDARPVRAQVFAETALTLDGDVGFPEQYRLGGRKLAGLVRVRFDIMPDGSVTNCRPLEQAGTLKLPALCPEPLGPFEVPTGVNTGRARGARMLVAISYQAVP